MEGERSLGDGRYRGAQLATLEYIGHASVAVEASDGRRLLIDPYNAGGFDGRMGYAPIYVVPEFVLAPHGHADHSCFSGVGGDFEIASSPGTFGPFEITRHTAAHDEYDGRRRGGDVEVTRVDVDDRSIVHLSDVGHSPWNPIPDEMCQPDVLLATCGGYYTIGAAQAWEWSRRMRPSVVVPIHYKTPQVDLPIRGRQNFEAHWRNVRDSQSSTIELTDALLSLQEQVVLMEQRGAAGA